MVKRLVSPHNAERETEPTTNPDSRKSNNLDDMAGNK
jgi:hypothetical protein